MKVTEVHQNLVGKKYHEIVDNLVITEDQGDCCGWASCEVVQRVPEGLDLASLVLKGCTLVEYDNARVDALERSVLNLVFTTPKGEDVVLGYELTAGSGSGWSYGAWVKLSLDGEELVAVYF